LAYYIWLDQEKQVPKKNIIQNQRPKFAIN